MVYDKARELARELAESPEYKAYKETREKVMSSDTNKALIKELHQLQLRVQASMVTGEKDEEVVQKLQKLAELLQFNKDTADFIAAEYRLNSVLSDVYKILAEAVDVDMGFLDQ
jgi:cell fate (sporulation/competence/biofilm development) regulator YlbF (YheA/YmcA/DUF963 family)